MWIGPRVTMAMGEDVRLFRIFSQKTANGVPAAALLLQVTIVTLMLLTQRFEAVLDYIQFSLTLCSFLTVLGVFVLRWREPDLPRPYKTWGYPLTPFIFLAVTFCMMLQLLIERPMQSLAGLATMALGLVVYAISLKHAQNRADVEVESNA
jgi:APA family basic amino acid/polyamine antiporter